MKPPKEEYDKIPTVEDLQGINIPGCYCAGCGRTQALYSYSIIQPSNKDENGKLYYKSCLDCEQEKKIKISKPEREQFIAEQLMKMDEEAREVIIDTIQDGGIKGKLIGLNIKKEIERRKANKN